MKRPLRVHTVDASRDGDSKVAVQMIDRYVEYSMSYTSGYVDEWVIATVDTMLGGPYRLKHS